MFNLDYTLNQLDRDGIYVIPEPIPPEKVMEFNSFLGAFDKWGSHVVAQSGGRLATDESVFACWPMHVSILAPHFFEKVLELSPIADAYLEWKSLLYSINSFETRPSPSNPVGGVNAFHRDGDDSKFISLFMLSTHVFKPEDGSHEFVLGSHKDIPGMGVDGREIKSVTGVAGTLFFAITSGLHRGVRPMSHPRILTWARWGVSNPPSSYLHDQLKPIDSPMLGRRFPADDRTRRMIHLIAK